ncbi:VanZ family protein [Streptomyces sp. NPDC021080]|uniref:VanZ family protein n=1 Tax=Streptomyces sp. NPDC021080 TaxID=3365110 RepID=UPI00378F15AA
MFDAVFGDDPWFLPALAVAGIVVGVLAWRGARLRRGRHAGWYAPLGFFVTGVVGVTLALRAGGTGSVRECVINHQITEPLHTTQGLWNLAMCIPLGLFGILALRRVLPVLAGVVLLPCVIELAQAVAPFVSGICDSADVEMNVAGGVIGLAVGIAVVRGRVARSAWARPVALVSALVAVMGIVCTETLVTLDHVDGSTVRDASDSEMREAGRVVRQAFGDHYRIGHTQVSPGLDGYNGWMDISLGGATYAELMWPGARRLAVRFDDSSRPDPDAFPVSGARTPHDARDAYLIADRYMRAHYPWAAAASHRTGAVGEKAGTGWITRWRFTSHGVVMPRSLDVQIDRVGRVSRLSVDFGPKRVPVPGKLIGAGEAERLVRRRVHASAADPVHVQVLKADQLKRHGDPYRIWWVLSVSDEACEQDPECAPGGMLVDAVTGETFVI